MKFIIFLFHYLIVYTVEAELLTRAGGALIYDTERNLTWFSDANYAKTINYNPEMSFPGLMTKTTAAAWVDGLEYAGFDDWRLPYTIQPDLSCSTQGENGVSTSYNCSGSELGHMFYTLLGGVQFTPISVQHNTNYELFSNINEIYGYYWATPEVLATNRSWAFRFDMGYQNLEKKIGSSTVWPVRNGDPLLDQPPDGDANFDGVINAADIHIVMQIIFGLRKPTAKEFIHLDIAPSQSGISQPDGNIDSGDLFLILRLGIGL